ncbi:hypothetical protein ACLOJK_035057 [Asimina triloba]
MVPLLFQLLELICVAHHVLLIRRISWPIDLDLGIALLTIDFSGPTHDRTPAVSRRHALLFKKSPEKTKDAAGWVSLLLKKSPKKTKVPEISCGRDRSGISLSSSICWTARIVRTLLVVGSISLEMGKTLLPLLEQWGGCRR